MPLLRTLLLLPPAFGCAVMLAGCQGGSEQSSGKAEAPPPPGVACPSKADIASTISKHDQSQGVIVSDPVVCDGDWVTAPMSYPGLDPARAVLRLKKGTMTVDAVGTDGLCGLPEVKQAPEKIKKALGEFC